MIDNETRISSYVVVDELRLNFLPHYLGAQYLQGEALVYDWAARLSSAYNGGSWDFFQLSNGGFYMAPSNCGRVLVRWHMNGYSDMMGADAFGIVVTLFACAIWRKSAAMTASSSTTTNCAPTRRST